MQLSLFLAPGQLLSPPFGFINNGCDYNIINRLVGFALAGAVCEQ